MMSSLNYIMLLNIKETSFDLAIHGHLYRDYVADYSATVHHIQNHIFKTPALNLFH